MGKWRFEWEIIYKWKCLKNGKIICKWRISSGPRIYKSIIIYHNLSINRGFIGAKKSLQTMLGKSSTNWWNSLESSPKIIDNCALHSYIKLPQWEFQDPTDGGTLVPYFWAYFVGIFTYIGLKNRPYMYFTRSTDNGVKYS